MTRYQKGSRFVTSMIGRLLMLSVSVPIVCNFVCSNSVLAEAKQSTLSITTTDDELPLTITPSSDGEFGKTGNNTVTVTTDNYSGYSLSIKSSVSRGAVNSNDDEVESISSAVTEANFSSSSTYNNQLGYKPNQYVTSSGGIDTTVQNSDYLPTPSLSGDLLAKTSSANVTGTSDNYTLSFGARVDTTMPAGTYTYTYVLMAVANSIVYNVTFDDNTTDTVTNMPVPNPQTATIDGGTAAEDSYMTLSDAVPVRNEKKFAGWCDVATTTDQTTGDDICSGTLYEAGDDLPIDQTAAPNITLYAVWVDTLFPIVWNQMGACEFHGATNGNITGSACTDYHDVKFIDTGVALYSQANYLKDFEIHFTLDHYLPSEQVNYFGSEDNGQQTFVNDKLGSHAADGKAPGVTVRRATSNIDFNSKFGDEQEKKEIPYAQVHDVSMFRLDNKIYYSYDGGPLVFLQDITGFNQQFDLTTWFGAYPRDDCDGSQGPCTSAKRIPEATMSNMYIRLGEYSDEDVHTINFKANDGTTTTVATYLIKDGNAVTTIPAAPVYADHYFQGWFTAQSGGTEVTTSTIPDASADYYAHWLGSVAVADIDNPVISLEPNETEMIIVNNASELEPYSFSSSNDNVATVNSTTGEITAVGPGTATITMTGATSGATQTISVTVAGQVIHVSFDSQGGTPASYSWDVGNGSSFTTLPEPTREDYQFKGWWTGQNGTGTELTTSTVFDSQTPTQYYAKWEQLDYVCKIAKPNTLHVEQCGRSSSGCRAAGFAAGADIEYGQLVASATMTAGDAYDCDINNDGDWDDEDERFYYVGTTEDDTAKFIYYRNISTDNPVYDTAITYLPTSSNPDWSNPNLATFNTGEYNNTVTRFLTYPEALELCDNATTSLGTNGRCIYLLEKSAFAYTSGYNEGIWMEKQGEFKNRIQTQGRSLNHNKTTVNNEVRPVIEVPIRYIEPYSAPAQTYTITFDPHNETQSWTETIDQGDDLSDVYPATDPSYTNHLFQGWFTAATGGSQISSSTEPSADTTYHAQWKGTVALATVAENSITVATGETATVSVTNAADLEGFSFSSSDPNVATIDSSTGVVTPVAAGTTNISITGATSSTTNQIATVTVTVPVVQYTVYFNPHNGEPNSSATVTAGQQIGSSNIPADPTPSGTDEVFMGWFTAATGGIAVDGTTTPSADGETYHAQYKKIVCKVETSSANLHTHDANVVYGQIASSTTPQAGDAYNCDVDYDDTYNAVNERFYYVGQDSNNNAVLVAWNSYYGDAWAPGTSSDTLYSYTDALEQLPANTSGAWDNPGLIEQEPGKAARFTTRDELASACNTTLSGLTTTDAIVSCDYFMEHSAYDGNGRSALWLVKEGSSQYRIHTGSGNRKVSTSTGTSMVRPTIVVPDKLIEKYSPTYLDVTNAVISNDLILAVGDQITIVVGNASQLEPYTFSSADSSKATVDTNTGVITGVGVGTTNIIMTGSQSGLYKYLEVTIAPAPTTSWTVTFNANGGSLDNGASGTRTVDDGDVVGALPTASKPNYRFFGWYTDDGTFYTEVYPEETVTADITYYAKWVEDTSSFPIEWAEINECIFTGTAVTGTYCGNTSSSQYYIDTAVQLFTQANYDKDFEVGFTITEYSPSSQIPTQGNQATFVSFKKEDSANNYPGFVVRRYSSSNTIEITSRWKGDSASLSLHNFASTTKTVKLLKRKEVEQGNTYYRVYYSVDGSAWTLYEDITNKTHFEFDTKVWFGGAANSNGTSPMRPLVGKMTDMYVRLGVDSDYTVELDANGGTLPSGFQNPYTITAGSSVGTLPTPTAPSANYTFGGWYNGNTLVSDGTQYIPQSNVTLVADWVYQSSNTPVVFDVSNNATRGFQALSSAWAQSPVNLTTFNEASPINNSTWGDTTELSELQYWEAVRSNFVNNQCFIQTSTAHNTNSDAVKPLSALSNWTSGSVDCSKPDVYDTKINAALTVRLNDSQGAVVAYAKADNGIIHNMIPGQTYYWEKTDDSSVYGYVTATSNGSSTGTRWVDTDVVRNVRDLGGLPVTYTDSNNQTVTGTLAYGRLFRGEKMQNVSASEFTNLGITTEYNVGDEYSSDTHLSDYHLNTVIHYNFDYNSGDENNANSNYMKAWTAVTNIMTDIANTNTTKNIFFHCRVGADRTGTVAYLLEGLLGVPDEQRYEEYGLTNVSGLYDRTRYYKEKSSSNNLKFVFMMGYVKTNADILNWYMSNPNSDMNLVQAFRSAMTVTSSNNSQNNNSQNSNSQNIQQNSIQNNTQSLNKVSSALSGINNNTTTTNDTIPDNETNNDSSNGYAAPLGVSSSSNIDNQLVDESSSSIVGLAIAAVAATSGAAVSYALTKSSDEEDS